ncbi:hypothetical protein N7481_006560 [Penicillium waksmanii]|uniref:uncharacterized protein n=1 Tax=Penicillium waksmanii TaxID=69791 RepID=UPI00254678EA|nr:uncharacterized protein N7481_006560 [Penicillium waksmanii]KAJ5984461.1 hypothetical protein N7481_006560 [Penicillium waksmanii]
MPVKFQNVDMDITTSYTSSTADWRLWIQRLQRLADTHEVWEYLDIDTEEMPQTPLKPERSTLQTLQSIVRSQQAMLATPFRTVHHMLGLITRPEVVFGWPSLHCLYLG